MTTACNALLGNDDKVLESDGGPEAAARVSADATADGGRGEACDACADQQGLPEGSTENDVTYDVASDEGGCGTGLVPCEGGCVDLTSASNCGACDNACGGITSLCVSVSGSYACAAGCPPSLPTQCGSVCVDTTNDRNHCGVCPNACSTRVPNAQPVCASGACAFECKGGYSLCSGACVDEQTDNGNCGGCGSGHVCAGGTSCLAGVCCNPIALPPSINVDATSWAASFKSSPTWNCNAAGTTTVDSTQGTVTGDNCGGTATADFTNDVTQSGGPNVMVVRLTGLTVTNNHVINLIGNKPITFLVAGDVLVDLGGKIDAGASGTTAGPGGSLAAPCSVGVGSDASASATGGGGGGFGTTGGTGKSGNGSSGGAGGAVSAGTNLQPLRGGCSGGTGGNGRGAAGAGGGAFEISASGTITIGTGSNAAILSAAGGGSPAAASSGGDASAGANNTGSGGGGSGGGILLAAPSAPAIGGSGSLRAHGGAAGSAQGLQAGTSGQDGHSSDNSAATGGTAGDSFGENGGNGGLCAGVGCATASAAGAGGQAISNFVGSGGGGGGGRIQVVTAAPTLVCN
jgi:hypothetical protein